MSPWGRGGRMHACMRPVTDLSAVDVACSCSLMLRSCRPCGAVAWHVSLGRFFTTLLFVWPWRLLVRWRHPPLRQRLHGTTPWPGHVLVLLQTSKALDHDGPQSLIWPNGLAIWCPPGCTRGWTGLDPGLRAMYAPLRHRWHRGGPRHRRRRHIALQFSPPSFASVQRPLEQFLRDSRCMGVFGLRFRSLYSTAAISLCPNQGRRV